MRLRPNVPAYIDTHWSELLSITNEADRLLDEYADLAPGSADVEAFSSRSLRMLLSEATGVVDDGSADRTVRTRCCLTEVGRIGLRAAVARTTMIVPEIGVRGSGYVIRESASGVAQTTQIVMAGDMACAAGVDLSPVVANADMWQIIRSGRPSTFFEVGRLLLVATQDDDGWRQHPYWQRSKVDSAAVRAAEAIIVSQAELMRASPIPLESTDGTNPSIDQLTRTWFNLSEAVGVAPGDQRLPVPRAA